jgi:hypothetical protein
MFICSLCTRILKLSSDSSIPPIVIPSRSKNKRRVKENQKPILIILSRSSNDQTRNTKKIVSVVQTEICGHNVSLDVVDSRDCFENTIMKWKKIVALMMGCGHNAHVRNGPTCKEKWTTRYSDYKRIWDYMVGMGHNEKFLDMSVLQIKSP